MQALLQVGLIAIGILEKFLGEIIGNLLVLREQDLLEPENILKLVLINLPCCSNFPGQFKVTLWAILKSASVRKLNPVIRTPLPGSVEVLQSEPLGINAFMTSVTGRVFFMFFNLFA